jgi:hypothetical protein
MSTLLKILKLFFLRWVGICQIQIKYLELAKLYLDASNKIDLALGEWKKIF